MSKNNRNNPDILNCRIGTLTEDGVYPLASLPRKFVLISAHLLNKSAISSDPYDRAQFTLKSGSTALGLLDTSEVEVGANEAADFALENEAAELDADSDLTLDVSNEGGIGTAEIQEVTPSAVATAGTYKLAYGEEETADIAFDATAAEIQAALRLLTGLENVVVTDDLSDGAYQVEFVGVDEPSALSATDEALTDSEDAAVTLGFAVTEAFVASAIFPTSAQVQLYGFWK